MASIRFTVHVDAALPSSVQASITRTIHQHMTLTPGQRGAPAAAAFLAAQAVQELLQAAGVATSTTVRRATAAVPPEVELAEGSGRSDCSICLEALEAGQRCCRPPCLHAFHGPCLRQWLRHSPTCPVCKLCLAQSLDGDSPPLPAANGGKRELRFRLAELAGLSASELRYVAGYLGITVERGAERPDLELMVLGSPFVKILARSGELLELAVGRLEAFLRSILPDDGAEAPTGRRQEKAELVGALFGSGRFVREQDGSTDGSEAGQPDRKEQSPTASSSPPCTEERLPEAAPDTAASSSSAAGGAGGSAHAPAAGQGAAADAAGADRLDGSGRPRPQDGQAGPVRSRRGAPLRSEPY